MSRTTGRGPTRRPKPSCSYRDARLRQRHRRHRELRGYRQHQHHLRQGHHQERMVRRQGLWSSGRPGRNCAIKNAGLFSGPHLPTVFWRTSTCSRCGQATTPTRRGSRSSMSSTSTTTRQGTRDRSASRSPGCSGIPTSRTSLPPTPTASTSGTRTPSSIPPGTRGRWSPGCLG